MSPTKIQIPTGSIYPKRLGEVLLEADLISANQIEVALYDKFYNPHLYLGEILAMRNWIRQETADFFAQDWSQLIKQNSRNKIGWYLQQAALLREEDIKKILNQHKSTGVRFGTVAVLQGYLKPTTLDFFLMYLFPSQLRATSYRSLHDLKENKQLSLSNLKSNCGGYHIEASDEEIHWIG